MIKATLRLNTGKSVLILGLTHEQLDRLRSEQPIHLELEQFELPGLAKVELLLYSGATVAKMQQDLEKLIGPDTQIDDRRRSKGTKS